MNVIAAVTAGTDKKGGRFTEKKQGIVITKRIVDTIEHCVNMGYSDAKTAEVLGIHRNTLRNWKKHNEVIKMLYEYNEADTEEEKKRQVEDALLKRAIGYTQTEVTRQVGKDGKLDVVKTVEKQIMPSTTAQIFWLKNRCGYEWDGGIVDDENESGVVVMPEAREEEE